MQLIADEMAKWPARLERALFGTDDPELVGALIDDFVQAALGVAIERVLFYGRGVGAVFGLHLADGRDVVVKVHRTDLVGDTLPARWTVQHHLADRGLPVPRPIVEPQLLSRGVATVEECLTSGGPGDARDPAVLDALAGGLQRLVSAGSELVGSVDLPVPSGLDSRRAHLWPTPHDLRFDLSAPGGEWIDDVAASAREFLTRASGMIVITHDDWRVENLRFEDGRLVGIFDLDSIVLSREPSTVGSAAHAFSTDWANPATHHLPSPDQSRAFVRAYERARGRRFDDEERATLDASYRYSLAYSARCEHSDASSGGGSDAADGGFRGLLAQVREVGLFGR